MCPSKWLVHMNGWQQGEKTKIDDVTNIYARTSGICVSTLPVLISWWITLVTCPLSKELSSLTRSTRQLQRTSRDAAKRISPTAKSDMEESTKRCLPKGKNEQ
uniref:Uncharacterized protein n=1 Tax=Denticeps clupeoides TaxID=299321 RepID=A0AAY4BIB9_9TELE